MKVIVKTKRHYIDSDSRNSLTLRDIRKLVEDKVEILVLKLPTKKDITSFVLMQILAIAEREEQKLPASLLAEMIRFRQTKGPPQ